jgi:hypothetical protein
MHVTSVLWDFYIRQSETGATERSAKSKAKGVRGITIPDRLTRLVSHCPLAPVTSKLFCDLEEAKIACASPMTKCVLSTSEDVVHGIEREAGRRSSPSHLMLNRLSTHALPFPSLGTRYSVQSALRERET